VLHFKWLFKIQVSIDKGKLRVIEGRKATYPMKAGKRGCQKQLISLSSVNALGIFFSPSGMRLPEGLFNFKDMNKKTLRTKQSKGFLALGCGVILAFGIFFSISALAGESKTINIRITIPKIIEQVSKPLNPPSPKEEKAEEKYREEKGNPADAETQKIELPEGSKVIVKTIIWEP